MSVKRTRYLKPQFCEDTGLAAVSRDARLFYACLWCFTDKAGVAEEDLRLIKRNIFPYDEDMTLDRIGGLIGELIKLGRLVRVEWAGKKYLYNPKFWKHQKFHPGERPIFGVPDEILKKSIQQVADQLPAADQPPVNQLLVSDRPPSSRTGTGTGTGIGIGIGTGTGIGIGTGMGTGEGGDDLAVGQSKLIEFRRKQGLNDDGSPKDSGWGRAGQ